MANFHNFTVYAEKFYTSAPWPTVTVYAEKFFTTTPSAPTTDVVTTTEVVADRARMPTLIIVVIVLGSALVFTLVVGAVVLVNRTQGSDRSTTSVLCAAFRPYKHPVPVTDSTHGPAEVVTAAGTGTRTEGHVGPGHRMARGSNHPRGYQYIPTGSGDEAEMIPKMPSI